MATDLKGKSEINVLIFKQDPLLYDIILGIKVGLLLFIYRHIKFMRSYLWKMFKLNEFPLVF